MMSKVAFRKRMKLIMKISKVVYKKKQRIVNIKVQKRKQKKQTNDSNQE